MKNEIYHTTDLESRELLSNQKETRVGFQSS